MKGRRVRALFAHGLSLVAYHLPLDAHPEARQQTAGLATVWHCRRRPRRGGQRAALAGRLPEALPAGHGPMRSAPPWAGRRSTCPAGRRWFGRRLVHGRGAGQLERAADLGCDAFLSGEVSEHTTHVARERGIHYLAAGHTRPNGWEFRPLATSSPGCSESGTASSRSITRPDGARLDRPHGATATTLTKLMAFRTIPGHRAGLHQKLLIDRRSPHRAFPAPIKSLRGILMSAEGVDLKKRRFLTAATGSRSGGRGLCPRPLHRLHAAVAKAKALGAPAEADISKLEPVRCCE